MNFKNFYKGIFYGKVLYDKSILINNLYVDNLLKVDCTNKEKFCFFWIRIHEKIHEKFFLKNYNNYLRASPDFLEFESGFFFEKEIAGGIVNLETITELECRNLLNPTNWSCFNKIISN